jgi:TRAP-type mannitol/chloroaromatic compound transport system permease large subunit
MNPTVVGIVGIAIMVLIFFSRMPVAYVMTLIGFLGFSFMVSLKGGLNLLSRNIYEVFSSYGLTTIPLFILMGQLAFNSGISRRLYDTAYKFLGSTWQRYPPVRLSVRSAGPVRPQRQRWQQWDYRR